MIRALILANPAATDAQIRALAMNKATERPIPREKLAEAAFSTGTIERLRDVIASGASTAPQKKAAQNALDVILFGSAQLPTNVEGSRAFAILAAGLTTTEAAAAVALGGGMRFVTLTVEQVAAERVAIPRDAAVEALWALAVEQHNAASAVHQTRNSKVADLRNDPTLPVPRTLAELDGVA